MGTKEHLEGQPRRRRRKKSHRVYAFFVIVLGLAIIALAVLLLFHVQKIEIKGNEYCADKEILEAVQSDKFSTNSLYVVGKYLLGKGEEPACLESMKVGIGAPWTLKVRVKEKPIVGYVYADQDYAYFDRDGLVVKKDSVYLEGIPRVEGIEVKNIRLYQPLQSDHTRVFEEILEASDELKEEGLSTDRIVCQDSRIYVFVGKVCVSLGNQVTPEKMAQIPPILEKLEGKEGTLHLESYSGTQETITFDVGELPEGISEEKTEEK